MSAVELKGLKLTGQISAVAREIEKRQRNYPGLVRRGQMRQAEAEYEIKAMDAVLQTLNWLWRNEEAVRGRVRAAGGEELQSGGQP